MALWTVQLAEPLHSGRCHSIAIHSIGHRERQWNLSPALEALIPIAWCSWGSRGLRPFPQVALTVVVSGAARTARPLPGSNKTGHHPFLQRPAPIIVVSLSFPSITSRGTAATAVSVVAPAPCPTSARFLTPCPTTQAISLLDAHYSVFFTPFYRSRILRTVLPPSFECAYNLA